MAAAGGRTQPKTGQNRGGGSRPTPEKKEQAGELGGDGGVPVTCLGGDRKPVSTAGGGSERREEEKQATGGASHGKQRGRGSKGVVLGLISFFYFLLDLLDLLLFLASFSFSFLAL